MKRLFTVLILTLFAANAIAQPEPPADSKKKEKNERLGLRAGYVGTESLIKNTFGGGMNLGLHWVQTIKKPVYIDFTLGAFYLGSTPRNDITFEAFQQSFDNQSMRILTFTIAPMMEIPVNQRTSVYVSGGVGIYTVSLLLDEAFNEFDVTDNHFGVNAGIGLIRRISTNWSLEFTYQSHKFWTGGAGSNDLFYIYSEGDQDPVFYNVSFGVMLAVF